MGWIGSILTRRGVQTVTAEREEIKPKKAEKEIKAEAKIEPEAQPETGEKQR